MPQHGPAYAAACLFRLVGAMRVLMCMHAGWRTGEAYVFTDVPGAFVMADAADDAATVPGAAGLQLQLDAFS